MIVEMVFYETIGVGRGPVGLEPMFRAIDEAMEPGIDKPYNLTDEEAAEYELLLSQRFVNGEHITDPVREKRLEELYKKINKING